MKLRNKLIPLFTALTASSAIAVPCVTSCSAATGAEFVDITQTYYPIYKRAKDVASPTVEGVQDIYFTTLKSNPDIIRDDILKYECDLLPQRIHDLEFYAGVQVNTCTNTVAKISVSNVAVHQHEAIIASQKQEFYTIDATLEYEFDYTLTSLDGTTIVTKKTSFKNKMTEIPSFVNVMNGKWYVYNLLLENGKATEYLNFAGNWSLDFDWKEETTTTKVNAVGEKQTDVTNSTQSGVINRPSQLETLYESADADMSFSTYYLSYRSYHLSGIQTGSAGDFQLNVGVDGFIPCSLGKNEDDNLTAYNLALFNVPGDMDTNIAPRIYITSTSGRHNQRTIGLYRTMWELNVPSGSSNWIVKNNKIYYNDYSLISRKAGGGYLPYDSVGSEITFDVTLTDATIWYVDKNGNSRSQTFKNETSKYIKGAK